MMFSWKGRHFEDRPRITELELNRAALEFKVAPTARARVLVQRYGLDRWFDQISLSTCSESLGTLDLLDLLPVSVFEQIPSSLRVLDVGSKNWRYLPALVVWLDHHFSNRSFEITGRELDAYRLYRDFRTRYSYGEYFAKVFSKDKVHCQYEAGDVRGFKKQVDWVTWFFPFVSPETHSAWGLSLKSFDPEKTFAHVVSLLSPGGTLVMANQGEWEWREVQQIFERLERATKIRLVHSQTVEGSLHESLYPIFLTVWTREE